ncbi:MAG: hypothetical protein FGF48_09240 [Candidatus Brockarchaeota archaeon]|nr:hypothetical protein [Candidatus Brockarchaeota archaeon]
MKHLKPLTTILLLLLIAAFNMSSAVGEKQLRLQRTLEVRILLNSTVLVRVSSTPGAYYWQYFKDSFYNLNRSYWHSQAIDMIIQAFGLTGYRVLGAGEDEAKYAFIVELVFQLEDSRRYVERNGTLSILDPYKPSGEYFSSVRVESEGNMYDCSPRDKAWPRIWYSTHELEWRNADLSDAPEEYGICFKIPLRIASNLPRDVAWRIYLNSEPVADVKGEASLIYVNEDDKVSVDRIIEDQEGVRYVCGFHTLPAALEVNRTLSFNYIREYRVSLDSRIKIEAVSVNGYRHNLPYEFWTAENTSLSVSVIPVVIEGSFTNHVFDGWEDSDGARLSVNFTVGRPMRLTAVWREELNIANTVIVVSALILAFLIPELRKRVSVEIIWEKPSEQTRERDGKQRQDV